VKKFKISLIIFLIISVANSAQAWSAKTIKKKRVAGEKNDMLAAASVYEGKKISLGCMGCHSFEKNGPTIIGPNLFGVYGAKQARRKNYEYSDALKKHQGSTWTVDNLSDWLSDPEEYAPGTKMGFSGLADPQERMDLIAYLMSLK
jgi:cytochrome c